MNTEKFPSTPGQGAIVTGIIPGVNMKATGDYYLSLQGNLRFILSKAIMVSASVAVLSAGATLLMQEVDRSAKTAAALQTSMTGANNDVTFTAVNGGLAGNSISVTLVSP